MYTARTIAVIEPDGAGTVYKTALVPAGEGDEALEATFRSGTGGLCQALKTYLEKGQPQ